MLGDGWGRRGKAGEWRYSAYPLSKMPWRVIGTRSEPSAELVFCWNSNERILGPGAKLYLTDSGVAQKRRHGGTGSDSSGSVDMAIGSVAWSPPTTDLGPGYHSNAATARVR